MSVQAQHPSHVLFSEFHQRARHETCDTVADIPVQERQLYLYSEGFNFSQLPVPSAGVVNGNGISGLSSARKMPRGEVVQQGLVTPSFSPTHADGCSLTAPKGNGRSNFPSAELNLLQLPSWASSSGIHCAAHSAPLASFATSTMGVGTNVSPTLGSLLEDAALNLDCWQQGLQIDHIIATHTEQLKQALEERRRQHTRLLLELIDDSVLSHVREKLVEIERLKRRNLELEECVKKLSLETQVWMNIAQSQEALVTNLRSNLEKVVAQSKEKDKSAETDAEDAESCVFGAPIEASDVNMKAREVGSMREQRKCRHCRKNGVSVLMIPCRHLCLCTDCDPTAMYCPICGMQKDASFQVYID